MTQMLLFESPPTTTDFAPSVIPVADCPVEETQPVEPRPQTLENDADRGGMHHMGDLARLVLMRYDLVAQRRAALAARRAK